MPVIKYYGALRDIIGKKEEFIDGTWHLPELLNELCSKYERIKHYCRRGNMIILLNGKGLSENEIKIAKVDPNDLLELMPPASGG